MMANYIRFDDCGKEWAGQPIVDIRNQRTGDDLGELTWYAPWGQWIARFRDRAVWSADCLRDVAAELTRRNEGG